MKKMSKETGVSQVQQNSSSDTKSKSAGSGYSSSQSSSSKQKSTDSGTSTTIKAPMRGQHDFIDPKMAETEDTHGFSIGTKVMIVPNSSDVVRKSQHLLGRVGVVIEIPGMSTIFRSCSDAT
jgi:hypothetical protein